MLSAWKSNTCSAGASVSQIHGEVRKSETLDCVENVVFAGSWRMIISFAARARVKAGTVGVRFDGSV